MSGMFRATTVVGRDVEKASRSEQEQPISPVQGCPNKNWIDLWYKYDSDRPVAFADYIILDESGQKIAGGKLNNNGFSHVTGIPDGVTSCTVVYTGDPKPFEIFNDKKPIKNPYHQAPAEKENEIIAAFKEVSKPIVSLAVAYHQFNMAATEWTWGAIQGDWNEDQTLGQIVFDSAISLIPFVDQAADVRDVTANLYQLTVKRRYDEFSPWFGLVLTVIGMIPELGTAIKGAVKSVVKVGKEAASFVLKKGVKFGEQLIVKSGIDIDSLIRAMNYFGEGNVVKWLRDQVDNFGKHKKFVMDQIRDILLKVKEKCRSLMNDVIESLNTTLAIICDNIDEVLKRVTDYAGEIMDSFKKAIEDLTKTVKDYWIKATTRTDNGARQIADGTTFAPAPPVKHKDVKSHPRASRMTREQVEKIAEDAGMEPEELMGLIDHCNKTNRRVVVRFTNPKSLQWHGKPGFVPKNVDVKLKTSKSGPTAGLVVKPKEPMEDWEIENINALKLKGYDFDGAGRLIDQKGNRIYGDYDLQSVHSVDPNTGKSEDLLSNPSESNNVIAEVNGGLGRKDREMLEQRSPVQHGAENDFYVKADADGKPVYTKPKHPTDTVYDPKSGQVREAPAQGKMIPATKEDIEAGNATLGKQYGDDEKYLVVNPDGTSEVLENPHELYEMNRKLGLPWRYDAVPPTGEQLAAEQAKRAQMKKAMEAQAEAEALAEQAQMESFIDDIIGDGKQFNYQPSNYVEIGATPF